MKLLFICIFCFVALGSVKALPSLTAFTKTEINDTIKPMFPGGEDSLKAFIFNNFVYPKVANRACFDEMTFILVIAIDTNGIAKLKYLKNDSGLGFKEEYERVLKLLSNWIPGTVNGKKEEMEVEVPIKIKLLP